MRGSAHIVRDILRNNLSIQIMGVSLAIFVPAPGRPSAAGDTYHIFADGRPCLADRIPEIPMFSSNHAFRQHAKYTLQFPMRLTVGGSKMPISA